MCSCISKVLATANVYIYVVCLHSGRVFTFRVFYGRDATIRTWGWITKVVGTDQSKLTPWSQRRPSRQILAPQLTNYS
jgi:hypothetical protein